MMKFLPILFVSLASAISVSNFTAAIPQCIDPAGTQQCIDKSNVGILSACEAACGCGDAFTCGFGSADCVLACGCAAFQGVINCMVSNCWNKVYSCEYQQLLIDAATYCPISTPLYFPFFGAKVDQPGSCSCALTDLWASQLVASNAETTCLKNNFKLGTECSCCAAAGVTSVYYDLCNTTAPEVVRPIVGSIPFNTFSTCDATLSNINCSDVQHGLPVAAPGLFKSSLQPNGTARTFSNQAGTMTVPPYSSTTAWYFLGTAKGAVTATAFPYKAGAQASGSISAAGGTAGGGSKSNNAASTRLGNREFWPLVLLVVTLYFL
ncbi:hypothetical protein BT63DRAFT_292646 [Microthyrium microscopicum]|uniref:Extracellular membrane protein CFEM domain-containing protein n=1 Tax=Microthyrium microscopicum TaxID=703497 RepID=A0A6A6U5M7_9PEZI|nr:hypothetical protein BT63DRAFT_292646 [Microthyrium microscopicum]